MTTAKPDLKAYTDSMRDPASLAEELRQLIGPRLVAYCTGVSETRAVHEWADGSRTPQPAVVERLRFLYHVVAMLIERVTPAVAQAWLQGMSPRLDDRAPARLIREGEIPVVGPDILNAARSFVAGA